MAYLIPVNTTTEVTLTIERKPNSGQFGMVRVDYRTLATPEIPNFLPFTSDISSSLARQGLGIVNVSIFDAIFR